MVRKMFDVNPQYFRMLTSESAANTFTEKEHVTPVVQIGNGKVLVMELLKWIIEFPLGEMLDGDIAQVSLYDRSKAAMPGLSAAGVIGEIVQKSILTTSGANIWSSHVEIDLTDGNGNGYLYAKGKIYQAVLGTSQAGALAVHSVLLYRLKEVAAEEFVGMMEE